MKTSFKVFVLAAALSLTTIYSKTISREIVESYKSCASVISIEIPQ